MAMIFQSYALWPHMTVAQNVAYGLRFARRGRAPSATGAWPRCSRAVQLAGYGARYPGELSGGQQQRVAVARALVVRARDPAARRAALATSTRTCARRCASRSGGCTSAFGITTLYVTHDQAEAMVISDRVAVMRDGRVAQIGHAGRALRAARARGSWPSSSARPTCIDAVADGAGSSDARDRCGCAWPAGA